MVATCLSRGLRLYGRMAPHRALSRASLDARDEEHTVLGSARTLGSLRSGASDFGLESARIGRVSSPGSSRAAANVAHRPVAQGRLPLCGLLRAGQVSTGARLAAVRGAASREEDAARGGLAGRPQAEGQISAFNQRLEISELCVAPMRSSAPSSMPCSTWLARKGSSVG